MMPMAYILGPHAYTLARYGVSPYDDVDVAINKLRNAAPHLARLLEEVKHRQGL
ncbi:MAG: hypothetical protein ABWK05_04720 [Pyrobaculum sp.]